MCRQTENYYLLHSCPSPSGLGRLLTNWVVLITFIHLIKLLPVVFDKDRSGFASSSEIKTVMANLGVHFSDEEIQEMMIEV